MAFWPGPGITRKIIRITGIAQRRDGAQRCGGLWRFLIVRSRGQTEVELEQSRGRTAVELERERNRATATAIQLVSPGTELVEYEPGGRLRIIHKRGPAANTPPVPGEVLLRPSGELDR